MAADYRLNRVDLMLELLQQTTSISVVSEFFRAKNLPHSAGSWQAVRNTRVLPALDRGEISEEELLSLLRSAEEHGRQHVFIYQIARLSEIAGLLNLQRVEEVLRRSNLARLIKEPLILDQPAKPTIVDVRLHRSPNGQPLTLTIKEVEQRREERKTNDYVDEQGRTVRIFEKVPKRAVNLVRLHRDGFLEMRVASHDSVARTRYQADVNRLWMVVAPFIPRARFNEVSLDRVRSKIYTDQERLDGVIQVSDVSWRGDDDSKLVGYGPPDRNFFEANSVKESLDAYAQHPGRCEGSNVKFLGRKGGPSKDIHVLLSGAPNEFAITANCSESDYESVLRDIRRLND